MMRKVIMFLIGCCLTCSGLFAQKAAQQPVDALEKLAFLLGDWEGSGWIMGPSGQKETFHQTERVWSELAGEVIMVEGKGMSLSEEHSDPKVIHHALAMISFNRQTEHYDFRSYAVGRGGGNFEGEITGTKTFVWSIPRSQGTIRYTISLNEEGQWFEVGEMERNGNWFQFFEMTLNPQ